MKYYLQWSKKVLPILLFSFTAVVSQTNQERDLITSRYDLQKLNQLQSSFSSKEALQKQQAILFAQQRGIQTTLILEDGGYAELQRIDADGTLIYYRTLNVDAARSTRTNHLHSGGSLGLNLMGQNMRAYIWDGGHARASHQEYHGAGGSNRYSVADGSTSLNYHAAHVTGTIMASGVVANAKGMAPHALVSGYDWNSDLSEATTAAGNGMLLSNHSYGYRSDLVPDYYFGAYITDSRDWDALHYNAPYYLMVVAAGNDGTTNYNGSPLNSGFPQYDKLTGHSTSKNNLVVASAQDANVNSNGDLISVNISSFSSQGPTDDYRIKPDITGNGQGVYSTYQNSNTAYNTISGTSMASPNVTGSLLLLQEHANNINGNYLRSATLKGLVLHTADDAGMTGPDAVFGWGLLNAKRAAETISNNGNEAQISELTLFPGQTYSIEVESDGINALLASISWTDPAGTATSATNNTTPRLVNDLDIRVSQGGNTYYPWRLTGVNTNANDGDNIRDPFERVDVSNASGTYTITITHKGTLSGGSQNFSLIITGISSDPVACSATVPTGLTPSGIGSTSAILSWDSVAGATYDLRYRVQGTTNWTSVAVSGTTTTISGLDPQTTYEAQVRSKCSDGTNSAYSSSVIFTTTEIQIIYCTSQGTNVSDEYISRVQLNTINNPSGSGNGYSDFTNISTDLSVGESYTITVTPTWTGTVYAEGYAVWIDYNNNGDFTDAGEQIWAQSPTTNSPVSGTFSIPSGAVEGSTRMRVSMKYNGIPTSCETFTWGEVEDYTVNIVGNGPDTQPPSAPTNLSASNITQTTVDLSWNASTDNVGVVGYDVYMGSTLLGTVAGTTATVTGLTESTTYNFTVKAKDAAGNESPSSNVVTITTLDPPDTEAPSTPTNLMASNVTQTTVDLSWNASTDNVAVTGYEVYQGSNLLAIVSGTSATVTGLSPGTTYSFSVRARDAAGNVSQSSNVVTITTESAGITYCDSYSTNTNNEWIQRVQIGDINNNSGNNGGYGNYTNLTTTLVNGTNNSITIIPGWSGRSQRETYRVWIDLNQDGSFDGPGELLVNINKTNASSVSANFSIPFSALGGSTRMRVSMKRNNYAGSCEIFSNGEVEDYNVFISPNGGQNYSNQAISNFNSEFVIYPNPVKGGDLNIQLLDAVGTEIKVFNFLGQTVVKQAFNTILDVSNLNSGVYFLEVTTESGQKYIKRFIVE